MIRSISIFVVAIVIAVPLEMARGDVAQNDFAGMQSLRVNGPPDPTTRLQGIDFFDDFLSYEAGVQLVVQNPVDWELWSGGSGTSEDPYVSDSYSYSDSNSVVIVENNDLVKGFGALTSGSWRAAWQMYIPSGNAGYFNTLAEFAAANSNWGMQVYFNAPGDGFIDAGGSGAATFNYDHDTWMTCEVIVDLDNDLAQFILDGDVIHTWQWTLGVFGGGSPLQLDANDFFGATPEDEMYVDDYEIAPMTGCEFSIAVEGSEYRPGDEVGFEVFLHHMRDRTVTVPVSAWIEDSERQVVASTLSRSLTIEEGDFITLDMNLRLPEYLSRGTYRLFGSIGEMKQGVASARQKFRVVTEGGQIPDLSLKLPGAESKPARMQLGENYPNPFNPSTTISYGLSRETWVTIRIYNTLGQEVATLIDGYQGAGYQSVVWNGRDNSGQSVASGVYIYLMRAGDFVEGRKLLLLE